MTVPYTAGCVWWGLLDFGDVGGRTKKYFVLLTDCAQVGQLSLVAITTSQGEKRYGVASGKGSPCACPDAPCYRIDKGQELCFPATTWIQFDNGAWIGRAKLDDNVQAGLGGFVQELSSERTRSILSCAKKSKDIAKRDIDAIDRVLKLLVGAAKKKVPPPSAESIALTSVRERFQSRCTSCRSTLAGLLEIPEVELTTLLSGSKPLPDGFMADAEAGFELVPLCACSKPSQPSS